MARNTQELYVCEDDGTLGEGIMLDRFSGEDGSFAEIILETTATIFIVPGSQIDSYRVEFIEEFFDA